MAKYTTEDFGQDVGSLIFGGESSAEEAQRKKREAAIGKGYAGAESLIGAQYQGPVGDKIRKLEELRALFDYGPLAQSTAPGDIRAKKRAQAQIAQLEDEIEQSLGYTPDFMVPTTDYDVTGYDVTGYDVGGYDVYRPEDISELDRAMGLEGLYPDRFGIPEYEDAAMQDPSLAALARADEGGMTAQREALEGMQDIYKSGGLTAIDRARLEESRRRNEMLDRAAREAILADMERRGISGSGVELTERLISGQGAAERKAQEALDIEAMALQRRDAALEAASGMGRDLAEDVFSREFKTGEAEDFINKFNTQGVRDVQEDRRTAQDLYADWHRAMLEGDVNAMRAIEEEYALKRNEEAKFRAEAENERNKAFAEAEIDRNRYLAEELNRESRYGADTRNTAAQINTGRQTDANRYRADTAWNQLGGYNQQQRSLADLKLGQTGALDTIEAGRPVASPAQGVRNVAELGKTVYTGGEALGFWGDEDEKDR